MDLIGATYRLMLLGAKFRFHSAYVCRHDRDFFVKPSLSVSIETRDIGTVHTSANIHRVSE